MPCRSLCKAAAVSTVMQLFILAVRRLSKVGRWGAYLLEGLRDAVDYVLSYAVCFIGIYGLSFSEGGCWGWFNWFHPSPQAPSHTCIFFFYVAKSSREKKQKLFFFIPAQLRRTFGRIWYGFVGFGRTAVP